MNNDVKVAYTDIWELTKDAPDKAAQYAMRITFILMFIITLAVKSLITSSLFAGLSWIGMKSIDWWFVAAYSLISEGMELIVYGTQSLNAEQYAMCVGDKEYELKLPSQWWKILIFLVSCVCAAFVSTYAAM